MIAFAIAAVLGGRGTIAARGGGEHREWSEGTVERGTPPARAVRAAVRAARAPIGPGADPAIAVTPFVLARVVASVTVTAADAPALVDGRRAARASARAPPRA